MFDPRDWEQYWTEYEEGGFVHFQVHWRLRRRLKRDRVARIRLLSEEEEDPALWEVDDRPGPPDKP